MNDEIDSTMEKYGFTDKHIFKVTSYFSFKELYVSDFDKEIKRKSDDDDMITKELGELFIDSLGEYLSDVIEDDDFEKGVLEKMKEKCDFTDLFNLDEFQKLGQLMVRFDYK